MIQFFIGMLVGVGVTLLVVGWLIDSSYERGAAEAIENLAKRRRSL